MQPVYFDTSVFLTIFMGESTASQIRGLLTELKRDKVKIYTSIISVQEVSVRSFQKGTVAEDNYSKIYKLARIEGVTKEIALTAAKYEAHILDQTQAKDKDKEGNRRRKWDCFHLATAVVLNCSTFYSADEKQLKRKDQFGIHGIKFLRPEPTSGSLFNQGPSSEPGTDITQ